MSSYVPNMSFTYLASAARFARLSYEIETKEGNKQFHFNSNPSDSDSDINSKLGEEDTCYSIASVIHAVLFVEAFINELFYVATIEKKAQPLNSPLDQEQILWLAALWEVEFQTPNQDKPKNYSLLDDLKPGILQKYQLALAISHKELFNTGQNPYQNVKKLINLRNELVHYKPKIVEIPANNQENCDKEKEVEKIFKTLNPFRGEKNPFFPDKCFGYGCAKWAVDASIKLIEEFSQKMDLPVYDELFMEAKNLPTLS